MSAPVAPPKLPTGRISINQIVEPNDWPADQVEEILKWAKKVGEEGVKEAIEQVRRMLGNPAEVLEHAHFWMRVESHLRKAVAYAQEKKPELNGRWAGDAEEAFNSWESGLEGALGSTANAAHGMMDAAVGMLDHITKTYNAALTLIANTYADLMDAAPGFIESVLPGGRERYLAALRSVAQILAAFVRNVNQFIVQAIEIFRGYQKSAISVGSAVGNIRRPPELGSTAETPSAWVPADFG